jgi:hypothetical protein
LQLLTVLLVKNVAFALRVGLLHKQLARSWMDLQSELESAEAARVSGSERSTAAEQDYAQALESQVSQKLQTNAY